jgi:hypothetical protein
MISWSILWACFHPFRDAVNSDQDVLTVFGLWEWSHEVNAPYVEQLNLKVVVKGHLIASGDATMHLALPASLDEFSSVLIH